MLHLNRVQVVPLTSNSSKIYPSEAAITFGKISSKAMADQLTTVSKQRLLNKAGRISVYELERIEDAIKIQLGL